MLPSSKEYLKEGGFSTKAATWVMLACFLAGMIGIQLISSFLHDHIPSHAVDCDHVHDETAHGHGHHHVRKDAHDNRTIRAMEEAHEDASESSPLLSGNANARKPVLSNGSTVRAGHDEHSRPRSRAAERRASFTQVPSRFLSFVRGTKANCDEGGPCYGYSDPCGRDCFKHLGTKVTAPKSPAASIRRVPTVHGPAGIANGSHETCHTPRSLTAASSDSTEDAVESDEDDVELHHHHVPENAFMSLGLQTSIAIALHKLPEGFITYATNHANPSLGFSVFTALFIHNITEGFSLALPLFLALHSRTQAILWSFLLGSVSQPLGAAIAASWFEIVGREGGVPGEGVYGCMFAVTAGIMTSVALTLLLEAISLNHNRNLCIAFGFTGMAMMGMSNALKG
jgi:ZIP family zinc transporter